MNINLTTKEQGLLKDAKGQEELCIKKYDDYASRAHCECLSKLFTSMANVERNHLKTINEMISGNVTPVSGGIENGNNDYCTACNYTNQQERDEDAFLCRDMLATEKHASSLYDVSVFEFGDPVARKVLNHIQSEEQQHGEQLYAYMKANNMYS